MSDVDWEKRFTKAFLLMDADNAEAEIAFRQVRSILRKQGLSFGHVLAKIQEPPSPQTDPALVTINQRLGRQLQDALRENKNLRVENLKLNYRHNVIKAFGRAAQSVLNPINSAAKWCAVGAMPWVGRAALVAGYTGCPVYAIVQSYTPAKTAVGFAFSAVVMGIVQAISIPPVSTAVRHGL